MEGSSVTEGQEVILECKVIAEPKATITWFKDGIQIASAPQYQVREVLNLDFIYKLWKKIKLISGFSDALFYFVLIKSVNVKCFKYVLVFFFGTVYKTW